MSCVPWQRELDLSVSCAGIPAVHSLQCVTEHSIKCASAEISPAL